VRSMLWGGTAFLENGVMGNFLFWIPPFFAFFPSGRELPSSHFQVCVSDPSQPLQDSKRHRNVDADAVSPSVVFSLSTMVVGGRPSTSSSNFFFFLVSMPPQFSLSNISS